MRTSLTRNLQIGFGLSLLLLVVSSVASFFSIQNLLKSADLVDHSNQVVERLESIMSTMKDAETGQRGYLLTGKDEFLEPYNGAYGKALQLIDQVQRLTIDNPQQQVYSIRMKGVLIRRLSALQTLINKKRSGEAVTVTDLEIGKAAMDDLRKVVDSSEQAERTLLNNRTVSLKQFTSITPLIIVLAALLAISVSVFSYIKVTSDMAARASLQEELTIKDQEISRRINIIQHIAGQISAGEYGVRVNDDEKDSLGSISLALNKMAESLQKSFNILSDNDWMQTGISQLNNQMIGEKPLDVLMADVLRFIAGYTGSQVGALYLLENDDLWLRSSFALTGAPSKIAMGEGLVGQAAKSDHVLWLKEIADEQIQVVHAAGGIKPRNFLIVPIHYESQVKGVIELASVYRFPDRKLEFLKNVADNIGLAVAGAQNRQRLQELLEETQAQSEELQAQHSELENLNTELEAHAQKLQTSEEELRVQQEELQQTNIELSERSRIIQERNIEIQQKAEELERTTRYKSEFMANMSHELRTPLNSILLLSRYLSENSTQNLTAEQIESAGVILSSGNGLLNLIDELLDLSKIEAGKMDLEYQKIPLSELVGAMQSLFAPVAKEKGLQFIINQETVKTIVMETDRMRLEQILKNLLSNAFKFTGKGQVILTVRQPPANPDILEFQVADTGIGIPKDKLGIVFEAFQQADGSTKRKFGGTGLGLSISRQLARLLGGEISVVSDPGKGSVFTLTLPLNRETDHISIPPVIHTENASADQLMTDSNRKKFLVPVMPDDIADDRNEIQPGDKTILIIEDDTPFAKALLNYTHKSGYKGITTVRGDYALQLAIQYQPVAILLDIHLPMKDGWDVMEELKANDATRHIPVHIMSSVEAKKESRLKGAVDFISKPIAVEQMKQMFQKLEEVWSRNPKKVLIVEENARHARALSYFLDTFNVSSTVSGSISESIDALNNKQVDCVIMDMAVPDKKAYETLETIKQNPGLEDLPIIIFTGKHLSAGEETRIRQYADTIVVKTAHSYQRILDEVTLFLHLVENQRNSSARGNPKGRDLLDDVLKDNTVLIADDDVRNIFSMTKSLEKYGMKVITATDGKEALEQLTQHPEISIVLMDMMMPEMDGYESTARIRQNPLFKEIPVIAVTAKAMLGDREKCIAAGASDYISKPVDVDQLTSLLRVWLFDKKNKIKK
ncbi:response regulator [Mucilaginibacter gotjawali]|uniref:histidine kinase n=2 Tax=Mucilaginibacter gotjawali TaxID=1550579 RepID=A0A110B326_9SPHI|nr:response regulator [Mucilaginibacter gotjawali]MBB3058167.1 signal transduction histidine kinase/DNA-binding response OmpR family regulator/CHASE3 domain sensor protein [Mucilaginibacter gotjawali]BAU54878.1 Autoinducer 2 sensor kinase/phosphatase LuxQ [Mucilaginibacter gotjawali]